MKKTLINIFAGLLLVSAVSTSPAEDGYINFYTYNPVNTNTLGKVFSSTGVAAVGPAYVGQLYGSTVSNLASMTALGVSVVFVTNVPGFITSGFVTAPGVEPGSVYYYTLRAWNVAAGGYSNASTNGIFGSSQIMRVVLGGTNEDGGFWNPPTSKIHPAFTLAQATLVAVTSSQNPSTNGNSVTFTATISSSSGTPTGSVIFRTNGVAMTTNAVSGGVATANTAALPPGTNSVVAEYVPSGDFAASANSLNGGFGGQAVVASSFTISGSLALQSFVGASRSVQFVLSQVNGGTTNYLMTTNVTLAFSGGSANYALAVPSTTTHISAKTAWNLRRRLAVPTFVGGAATVNFTAANNLKGGDLITVTVPPGTIADTDNAVTSTDYLLLLGSYLQTVGGSQAIGRADVDGDGAITSSDYLLLLGNYLTTGDPQ